MKENEFGKIWVLLEVLIESAIFDDQETFFQNLQKQTIGDPNLATGYYTHYAVSHILADPGRTHTKASLVKSFKRNSQAFNLPKAL